MLMVQISGALNNCHANLGMNMLQPLILVISYRGPFGLLCHKGWRSWSVPRPLSNQFKLQHFSHRITLKRWLVSNCFICRQAKVMFHNRCILGASRDTSNLKFGILLLISFENWINTDSQLVIMLTYTTSPLQYTCLLVPPKLVKVYNLRRD